MVGIRDSARRAGMRRLLLVANHQAFNKNMVRWACVLGKDSQWEPVLFSTAGSLDGLMEQIGLDANCRTLYPPSGLGWSTGGVGVARESTSAWAATRKRVKQWLPRAFEKPARVGLLISRTIRNIRVLRRQIRYLRSLLREQKVEAILLSETSPAYDAPVFIRAARMEGVGIISAPIDNYGKEDHAEQYLTDTTLDATRGFNRLVGQLYPKWVIEYKNRRILRVAPDLLLAQEFLGLSSPQPWRMVGAWEDAVATTSEAMRDFYLEDGVAPERLNKVGSAELDLMRHVLRDPKARADELCESLGLTPGKPIILTALVANHYLSGRPEAEYGAYSDLIEAWIRPLAHLKQWNVIVNLHPSQSLEQFRHIEEWGGRICRKDITSLIPLSDLYIACSSTARLAVACGKPLIFYDAYRYTRTMRSMTLTGAEGSFTVMCNKDYVDILKRLTDDPEFYEQARTRQIACSRYWGELDGRSAYRLKRVLDSLAANSTGCNNA